MKITVEDKHYAVDELQKVYMCLEKSEKTDPNTLKKIKNISQRFENSIDESIHIRFNSSEINLMMGYLKHIIIKRDLVAVLFIDAKNTTDYVGALIDMVQNELHGNVVSIFEKNDTTRYSSHIILGLLKANSNNDVMLAAKIFCN